MGRSTFRCACGFYVDSDELPKTGDWETDYDAFVDAMDNHVPLGCCNCGGQTCGACASRTIHEECRDDCPTCCPPLA